MYKHVVLITGAAGYIGGMLCDQYVKMENVALVVAIDKEEAKDLTKNILQDDKFKNKFIYLKRDLSDTGWEDEVSEYNPNVIIHTAWQIREIYGDRQVSYKLNIEASKKVFDFAFYNKSVERLVHFSTVASYGAEKGNSTDCLFTESDKFRKSDYLYAEEKRWVENILEDKYLRLSEDSKKRVQVYVVRPASITGPRLRNTLKKFGLQSALSGSLKGTSLLNDIVSSLTLFMPITKGWVRQYVHEDDITSVVTKLSFDQLEGKGVPVYEVFNICPPGQVVRGEDMAGFLNKKYINIHPQIIRLVFFIAWHVTRGRIPTSAGVWKSYSYPVAVDGSKITKDYDYEYKWSCKDAYTKGEGKYFVDVL